MGGDDEAVRNGDDDGESGADLELFRQLVAMPPKKCRRAACSSMSLCGVATSNCPNKTRKQSSGSRHRHNGVSATSHRTERIMRVHRYVGKEAMIVTILLAVENGARSLCLKALCTRRYRTTAPAVERVCCKAVALCSSGVGADTVGAQRVRYRGNVEASHCYTLLFRCADRAVKPLF